MKQFYFKTFERNKDSVLNWSYKSEALKEGINLPGRFGIKALLSLVIILASSNLFAQTSSDMLARLKIKPAQNLTNQPNNQNNKSANLSYQTQQNGNALSSVNYTYIGTFKVGDGPCWTSEPQTYTAQEAAALKYGGVASDYAISVNTNTTDQTTITHTAWLDGYGDTRYFSTPASENFKQGSIYTYPSFSAFVKDHSDGDLNSCGYIIGPQYVNYVWKIAVNPPAATFTAQNVTCQSSTDGSLTISNVSGNGPFQYSVDGGLTYFPGGTSYTFSNLGAGNYTLMVKDANNLTTSATKMLGLNRVINGDFEGGNTGFTTGYHLNNSGIIDEGEYSVEIVPSHGCFQGPDHSPTGAGFAFHANGSSTPNTTAWQQEIAVEPNTTYYFSTWIKQQCGAALPQLQFSINGNTVGSVFSPTALFQWQQFFTSWNSGANTTATIRIVNQSLALSGNDFSLDDISFTTVPPLEIASVNKAEATCAAAADGSITITAQGGTAPYTFSMNNGVAFTSGSNPYTFANVAPGVYTVKVKDNCGFESAGQQVTVGFVDNIKPAVITKPLTIQLDATGNASITAAQVNNGSSDACGIQTLALDITSFNCSNVGANTVTLTVTDVNGNQNSGTATITVEDKVLPTVVTKNITVTLANGIATITEDDINNGSNDACGIEYLGLDITSFDCSNLGANTVTLTAEDNNGNYNSETAIVTVLGAIPAPGISVSRVGANVYTGADEKTIFLGYGNQKAMLSASNATSLAGNTTYSWSPAAGLSDATIANPVFTPTAQGSYTFTVTATNEFGCTATKSETITVINAVCGQKSDKVLVCHNGSEICVSANAVPAHLAHHGDKLGSCNPEFATARIAKIEPTKPATTLLKAYPNPFTASTNVEFMLAENGNFKAELLDMKGQLVKVIASEAGKAGETYGYEIGSANLANGIYLVRLVTASEVKILKLVLDK